jgi:hypothetical protein
VVASVTALVFCGVADASAAAPTAPQKPTLGRWVEQHSGELENSDGHVFLRIDPVPGEPGTTVRLRYAGPQQNVTYAPAGSSSLIAKVTGLTNGKTYTFTAVVCNAARRCSTSDPFAFVPYKAMSPASVQARVRGRIVHVAWSPIRRNYSPLEVVQCRVDIHSGPAETVVSTYSADPDRHGSVDVTGVAGGTYFATHECSIRGVVSPLQGRSRVVTVP